MGLGEILLRSGELTLQQYNHAMDRLVVQRRIGALLCELGYLDADGLMRALERQASAIVLNAIRYRTGSYTVEFSDEFPPEIVSLPLNTERLILDGVQSIEYWSLISRGVARLDRILQQVPGADMRTYAMELTDDESHVLNLLSDPGTIEEICARSYLSNFITCRTVWALMSVNLIAEAAESTVSEQRAAEETEYELEAFVERYNRVFERIFAIVFQTHRRSHLRLHGPRRGAHVAADDSAPGGHEPRERSAHRFRSTAEQRDRLGDIRLPRGDPQRSQGTSRGMALRNPDGVRGGDGGRGAGDGSKAT